MSYKLALFFYWVNQLISQEVHQNLFLTTELNWVELAREEYIFLSFHDDK